MSDESSVGWEFIGFNGVPLVECGFDLPCVRDSSTGLYCKWSSAGSPASARYNRQEIDEMVSQGRLTLLQEAVPFHPKKSVAVWVEQTFLNMSRFGKPSECEKEPLNWQPVVSNGPKVWATCGERNAVVRMLNNWGRGFLEKIDRAIEFRVPQETLVQMAELGLAAAVDDEVRLKLYVRLAVAKPDAVDRLFEFVVGPRYPAMTQEQFDTRIRELKTKVRGRVDTDSHSGYVRKLSRIGAMGIA